MSAESFVTRRMAVHHGLPQPRAGAPTFTVGMAEVLRLLQLDDGFDAAAQVAALAAEALGVDGQTVSLATGGERAELMWCTDEAGGRFEDLQFTLGEGPGPEAVLSGAMVLVPDLARVGQVTVRQSGPTP
ncbi:hypothetical protein [Streptacidiphilus anmyonensis]|uniref:hypothetical protein n=1 Tax=Streptacidiphilus anmyonensis TaxID=405782 RepID=UPI0006936876|nr:hypothetical protein [Streptacidiphilus anmyonensis]